MSANKDLPDDWYRAVNVNDIHTPALLVYPDRISENIRRMISVAGHPGRLHTHVKTHKMSRIVQLQTEAGITKFKCATIAEAEMTAACGATSVILAIQPTGPNIERLLELSLRFPRTSVSCIADNEEVIRSISSGAVRKAVKAAVWLDLNTGMNRTGIQPGQDAVRLYRLIEELPNLEPAGLHVYDGHIYDPDFEIRKKRCDEAFIPVTWLIDELSAIGLRPPSIVAGGTPSFPVHAEREIVSCSPGTTLLWDHRSSSSLPDMDFQHAAVLLTRVISQPAPGHVCIDLGHKAVASEMPQPRVMFFGIDGYTVTNHSEEHMVIRCRQADKMKPGDHLYCIPAHICPTTDRYSSVTVVRNGIADDEWTVDAHSRKITV